MERAAIEAGSSEAQLMEEAGLASAQEAWMLLGTLEGRQIVVLAGPGNNGGDGLVAARHLHDWGAEVAVVAPRGRAADSNLEELTARGMAVTEGPEAEAALRSMADAHLVVDALLGWGRREHWRRTSQSGRHWSPWRTRAPARSHRRCSPSTCQRASTRTAAGSTR